MALSISSEVSRPLSPKDIAEEIWERRTKKCSIPSETAGKAILVASIIGQYEIEVSKTFLIAQTDITESQLFELSKVKLVRLHGDKVNGGHRSFCALLSKYLGKNEVYWEWFKKRGKPSNPFEIVLDFLYSLPPSEVWPILKSIEMHGRFKTRANAGSESYSVADYWKELDFFLEKIMSQQRKDPTWGSTPSSATFAIECLCSLGMKKMAKESIDFIRSAYTTVDDELSVNIDALATTEDFKKIKNKISYSELRRTSSVFGERAEDLDENRFHENWVRGLILCAEAAYGEKTQSELMVLAELVEKSMEIEGYFYPMRVPWCTARILIGLGACGRSIENSPSVKKIVSWLLKPRKDGGPLHNDIWDGGTGGWNSVVETTGMCISALLTVGVDREDSKLIKSMDYLVAVNEKWTERGSELDGVVALETYSAMERDLEKMSEQLRTLLDWAKSTTLWFDATQHSDVTLAQSCLIAQVTATLIKLTWRQMSDNLPTLLRLFTIAEEETERPVTELPVPVKIEEHIEEIGLDYEGIIKMINERNSINLSDYYVVKGYVKYDEIQRNRLQDLYVRISRTISEWSDGKENYLIWAPPSSGKTYLVKKITETLSEDYERDFGFVELNLAKYKNELEFRGKLHDIQKDTDSRNIVAFIDEIDSKEEENWPLETLLPFMEINEHTNNTLIWILAGSSGQTLDEFRGKMETRSKGKDLLTRIPEDNIIEIEKPSISDKFLLICSYILSLSAVRKQPLNKIEKFALFYLIHSPDIINPRQLKDVIHSGIRRVDDSDDRLMYQDLFSRTGEKDREYKFWAEHKDIADDKRFSNTYIKIKDI